MQLHATGNFKDKTTKDLTDSVTWGSGDSTVAHVNDAASNKGLVSGVGQGATTITADINGVKGVSEFTVTNASLNSITLEPVNPSLAGGTTVQMGALGNFSDGTVQDVTTQVSWNSGNSAIAGVSNSSATQGLVTGRSVGNTSITATLNSVQGSSAPTVTAATLISLTITPPDASIPKGAKMNLSASGKFSDGTAQDLTNQVSWTSANGGIARISDTPATKGLVTGLGAGSTAITVTLGGIQGSTTLTVSPPTLTSLTITPPSPSIAKGTSLQLSATGNFSDGSTQDLTNQVSWTAGDNGTAQVSNVAGTQGLVSGLSVGNTSITVALNGIQVSTTVTVSPPTLSSLTITAPILSIAKGTTVKLSASGNFSDGSTQDLTNQVSWSS